MSEAISAHICGSVVNSIAHQNLRYLRQKAVDEYWDEKAKALVQKRALEKRNRGKKESRLAAKQNLQKKNLK